MKGAHNTLSAYRATSWWGMFATPVWRCQRKKIPQLIEEGVRLFDIRVCRRVDSRGCEHWLGAHGVVTLNVSAMEWLLYINRACLNVGATVRLVLERGGDDDRDAFVRFCRDAEQYCPAIRFIGGRFKPTWEPLYVFARDLSDEQLMQHVGSMDPHRWRRLVGKVCPWLWHRLWGGEHDNNLTSPSTGHSLILLDFI